MTQPYASPHGYAGHVISFIVRLLVTGLAVWVAAQIVGGIDLADGQTSEMLVTLLGVTLIFTVVNMLVKPLVQLLSLPLLILSLGLFAFVINALMLMLTSWLAEQLNLAFSVDGFGPALLGALIITFVTWLLYLLLPRD
ncbi:MAG TPA: phage holin family protein [Jiangellaceae bacterium]|nr:phage holin family protein [Jiangellaceae bacterium]